MNVAFYKSPVGILRIEAVNEQITAVCFDASGKGDSKNLQCELGRCLTQLDEYFSGKRKQFNLTLDPAGTDFQKKVWGELQNIPFGKTISYMDLAKRLGDPKVIRAAGSANGKNPIAVIIPCHRVIGTDGSLTGYAGGLERKRWLLEHESSQMSLF